MHFVRSVFVGLSAMAALAAAQNIAFTSVPTSLNPGDQATVTWSTGNNNEPVTLVLRKGDPKALGTVTTITSTGGSGSYTWTVPSDLPAGEDYALEIQQGGTSNYSGQIAVGGTNAAPASAVSAAVSAAVSSAVSSAVASISASAASASASVSSEVASLVSSLAASANASVTAMATASSGVVTVSRNTTMSSATLSRTTATESTTTTSTATSTRTSAAATTATAGAQSSAAGIGSPLALVLTAFVAMLYLN